MMTCNYKNKSELYLGAADTLVKLQQDQYAVVPHSVLLLPSILCLLCGQWKNGERYSSYYK